MKLPPHALWKFIRASKPERTAWFELAGNVVLASSEPG